MTEDHLDEINLYMGLKLGSREQDHAGRGAVKDSVRHRQKIAAFTMKRYWL